MKLKLLSSLVAVNLVMAPTIVHAEEDATSIGELILDKAKSQFVSKVGSLLIDAIFGSSGPQYVNLSEASLQEIQNRVREELVSTAEFEFFAEFSSLKSSLNHYSDTVIYGNPDAALLSSLVIKTNDVMSHHAFSSGFNEDYYYMADSYALASSVAMSVYTERHLNNFIPESAVSIKGDEYGDKLESMVDAKRAAFWPLSEHCYDPDPLDQDVESKCKLSDPFGNTIAFDSFDPRDRYDTERWRTEVDSAKVNYYEENIGKLEDVVVSLKNF